MIDKIIKNELASWHWTVQTVGEDKIKISSLINRINNGVYRTEKFVFDIDSYSMGRYDFGISNHFDFIIHSKLVEKADLKYPIIVANNGDILDGKHRIVKAILKGKKTLKAIRLLDSI